MGKVTGFKEFDRVGENHLAPKERVRHYREFTLTLEDEQARVQGARCMECGVAYCNHACPLANLIPDFNDQVYHGLYEEALADYEQSYVVQQPPRLIDGLYSRAQLFEQLGRYREAAAERCRIVSALAEEYGSTEGQWIDHQKNEASRLERLALENPTQ